MHKKKKKQKSQEDYIPEDEIESENWQDFEDNV